MFSLSALFNTFDKCSLAGEIIFPRFLDSNDPDGVVIIFWLKILCALWPRVFWKYQPIALVFAKKLQSYQAYLYSNQMNEKAFFNS